MPTISEATFPVEYAHPIQTPMWSLSPYLEVFVTTSYLFLRSGRICGFCQFGQVAMNFPPAFLSNFHSPTMPFVTTQKDTVREWILTAKADSAVLRHFADAVGQVGYKDDFCQ
jgi:hypothetical protein